MCNTNCRVINIKTERMQMKKITIGILAHVDAGKTTLSEAMLYTSGNIRKIGRVDNGDAFLDTYELERARGITIFSKQAVLNLKNMCITLLDTPGHVDFSAEMERTLNVLDYAVLVISGADGVQGHSLTLWRLLKEYNIPVFIFVNKMDQNGADKDKLLEELKARFDDGCIDFNKAGTAGFYESIAMCDEKALDSFLETERVSDTDIKALISQRKVFPCFFGSALKLTGVDELLNGIDNYTSSGQYNESFGARVFKIGRDEQGTRLTFIKVTGGVLKVKMPVANYNEQNKYSLSDEECWEEKVNQIRIYSGERYEAVNEAEAGSICAVTGLSKTYAGEGLGAEAGLEKFVLEPVLNYQIKLPEGCDPLQLLPKLRLLEEEEPQLHIVWNEKLKEIQAQLMGEVQAEILKSIIKERFDVEVEFGTGNIVYKETILDKTEGVGHFEPLRHYAEVHLILEPGERGSGLKLYNECSEDMLDRNWQRLILTHLKEKEHIGVLAGFAVTDIRITLIAGRAHQKHTEGGDFRQATYRAVRNGLKQARSVLLEPYYEFKLEVPGQMLGRAMNDIERMSGTFETPYNEGEMSVLKGTAPVITMRDYHKEVISYTKGLGRLACTLKGYDLCHNENEIIEKLGYDSERDIENPTGSVFCAHGSGFTVSWDKVRAYMHIEAQLERENPLEEGIKEIRPSVNDEWIDTDEVDAILMRAAGANKRDKGISGKSTVKRRAQDLGAYAAKTRLRPRLEEYLLVDGYNIIFAWEELSELAKVNIEGARGRLLDILCNYQGIKKCSLIVVFDAYRVAGHSTEVLSYHNIHVVYTKEAETADQYIEKFAHKNSGKYDITVATSDGLEQIIIRGQGCRLLSARGLEKEIDLANSRLKEEYIENQPKSRNYLFDKPIREIMNKEINEKEDKESERK